MDQNPKNLLGSNERPIQQGVVILLLTLDQYAFLGNCPPTPPLIQHFALTNDVVSMLG